MFEKYDGLRGFWNPTKKAFYSRLGNKFTFPQDVIDSMPDIFLDGELWYCIPFHFPNFNSNLNFNSWDVTYKTGLALKTFRRHSNYQTG